MGVEQIKKIIKQRLSVKKYTHSINVAETAQSMAKDYGIDSEKAFLTGLVHDYARELNDTELLSISKREALLNDAVEEENPMLLHGPVGALLVEQHLGLTDTDMLNSIAHHTLGRPGMSSLEKVIYVADAIEPGRKYSCAEKLREKANKKIKLNELTLLILKQTITYNLNKGMSIHPMTIRAINYYQKH